MMGIMESQVHSSPRIKPCDLRSYLVKKMCENKSRPTQKIVLSPNLPAAESVPQQNTRLALKESITIDEKSVSQKQDVTVPFNDAVNDDSNACLSEDENEEQGVSNDEVDGIESSLNNLQIAGTKSEIKSDILCRGSTEKSKSTEKNSKPYQRKTENEHTSCNRSHQSYMNIPFMESTENATRDIDGSSVPGYGIHNLGCHDNIVSNSSQPFVVTSSSDHDRYTAISSGIVINGFLGDDNHKSTSLIQTLIDPLSLPYNDGGNNANASSFPESLDGLCDSWSFNELVPLKSTEAAEILYDVTKNGQFPLCEIDLCDQLPDDASRINSNDLSATSPMSCISNEDLNVNIRCSEPNNGDGVVGAITETGGFQQNHFPASDINQNNVEFNSLLQDMNCQTTSNIGYSCGPTLSPITGHDFPKSLPDLVKKGTSPNSPYYTTAYAPNAVPTNGCIGYASTSNSSPVHASPLSANTVPINGCNGYAWSSNSSPVRESRLSVNEVLSSSPMAFAHSPLSVGSDASSVYNASSSASSKMSNDADIQVIGEYHGTSITALPLSTTTSTTLPLYQAPRYSTALDGYAANNKFHQTRSSYNGNNFANETVSMNGCNGINYLDQSSETMTCTFPKKNACSQRNNTAINCVSAASTESSFSNEIHDNDRQQRTAAIYRKFVPIEPAPKKRGEWNLMLYGFTFFESCNMRSIPLINELEYLMSNPNIAI